MNSINQKSAAYLAFELPSGNRIKNRLVKASMEENMSDASLQPSDELIHLYERWALGGAGMILTGNVMIDGDAMTGPGGVVLERMTELSRFKRWANAGKQNNTKMVMQINHPGRQVYEKMQGKVLSPSDVALELGSASKLFGQPTPMTEEEINDVIRRFVDTAKQAEKAGFDGVQIHAAHGYLLAQFLSPRVNKRQDKWGGSLENRARLLLSVVEAIKASVSDNFIVAVKLNSADFQRGGFDIDDAKTVVNWLQNHNIDFVELSGGSYEVPAMQGVTADGRTLAREAYFIEFAKEIAEATEVPIMTTGGVRRLPIAEKVLASGAEMVGIATALALEPDLANRWQTEPEYEAPYPEVNWRNKTSRGLAIMAMVKRNLRRAGAGATTSANISPFWTLLFDQLKAAKLTKRYLKLKQGG